MLSIGPYAYDDVAAAVRGLSAEARRKGESDPDVHRSLAEALALAGRAEEAIEAYSIATTAGAIAVDYLRLAEMLMRRQRPLEARAQLVKAAAADIPDPKWQLRLAIAFDELADAYFAAGDLPTALECHDMSWHIVPGRVESAIAAALKRHEDNVLREIMPELNPASDGGPTLYAALVVWGETYTHQFLDLSLPSLLAPGNLPALAARQRVMLTIFASRESIAMLEVAEAFATLRDHAEVICVEIPDALIEQTTRSDYPTLVRYRITDQLVAAQHQIALIMAAARGAGVLFLAPDWVLSDGCLRTIQSGLEAEREIFVTPIILADRNRLADALVAHTRADGVLSVSGAELARHSAASLHEIWRQFVPTVKGHVARQFPSTMIWPFSATGFVLHSFHWSTLCVSATRLARYEGQRFWSLDHRLIDALLHDDKEWPVVTLCRDPAALTIVAFGNEGDDRAVATDAPAQWGVPEIVAEATPGTNLLSMSRANHLLFREPVVFGAGKDIAARDAALARARDLVAAIGAEIADVAIKRV